MTKTNLSSEMAAAAAEAARVVNGVPDTAGTLDAPTLCPGWDLRTLLNHTILWTAYSAERRAHGESVAEDLMNKDFTADPGFRDDYARQINEAVRAWHDPKAWEGKRNVMGNATGQEYALDDAAAEAVLQTVEAQAELFRKYQGFADAIDVPDDATTFGRALRLSGRDPRWQSAQQKPS